jgi:Carboxymuconolactone decarboxylase family
MSNLVEEFNEYRSKMNDKLLADNNLVIKRMRCDDCIKYHLETSHKEGITKEEMMEAMGIATLVGGTIVIPHLRRAYEFWEALENEPMK